MSKLTSFFWGPIFWTLFSAVVVLGNPALIERRPLPPSDAPPEDWTRIPYYESRPEFKPTSAELKRGFAL
ncbi:MAG: hypothetical protein Q4D17_09285, partial [Planctomycetia bacterium]|nr:hypothetical protein [Planctomycetia bacterium]